MRQMREGYVAVAGGRIWYGIAGEDKSGAPLVVVHGGPGAPHDYLEPLAALADERPIIFYDQLGCGSSDKPEDVSLWKIERFVEELVELRTALKLTHVHLLGQSWGSSLVVEYLLTKRSQAVIGAVLSGPLISASRWIEDQRAYLRAMPQEVQEVVRKAETAANFQSAEYQQAMMQFYRRHVCRMEPWPECLNRTFEKLAFSVYLHMWGPSEFSVTGTLKDYERMDRLHEIAVPVMFTCGQYDEAASSTVKEYQRHLAGSEMVVLRDASHEHHLEKTEEYLAAVRGFLRRAAPS